MPSKAFTPTPEQKVLQIATRTIADRTCQRIDELVSDRQLTRLHPYAAQGILEETIRELERRV